MKNFIFTILFFSYTYVTAQLPVNIEANDCVDAIPICGNVSYSTTSQGTQGDDCDITATNRGCIGGTAGTTDPYPAGSPEEIFCRYEYSPTWFYFNIQSSGTLEFLAGNSGYDLDFALWGPINSEEISTICDYVRNNSPIRCNFCSGAVGNATGIQGNGGNGPCPVKEPNLSVNAGETYILVLMQWVHPPSPIGFDLWFNGGTGSNNVNSTALLDCTILPVDWEKISTKSTKYGIDVEVSIASISNPGEIYLERSRDGIVFEEITPVSVNTFVFKYLDTDVSEGTYFYRMKEYSLDGSFITSPISEIYYPYKTVPVTEVRRVDMFGRENPNSNLQIIIYSDGSSRKVWVVEE